MRMAMRLGLEGLEKVYGVSTEGADAFKTSSGSISPPTPEQPPRAEDKPAPAKKPKAA